MKTLYISAALAAVVIAVPVSAQTYVGVSGGAKLQEKSDDEGAFTATVPATASFPAITSGTSLTLETEYDTGYNISGVIGHRFPGGLRIEGEVAFSRSDVDSHRNLAAGGTVIDGLDVAVLTRGAPAASNPRVGDVIGNGGSGRIENLSAFANLFYDFNAGGRLQPYVGAGLGATRVKVRYAPSDVPVAEGSETRLGYQLMGGLTFKVSSGLELYGQYAYRGTDRVDIPLQIVPARWDVENKQSVLSLGLRVPHGG